MPGVTKVLTPGSPTYTCRLNGPVQDLSRKNYGDSMHKVESWIKQAATPCYGQPLKGPILSERTFLEKFPGLIQEQILDEDGVCKFIPYYNHLNEMIEKWDGRAKYDVTHSPSPCIKRNQDSQFILFGIKSMPRERALRDMIRQTWLNQKYWTNLSFEIKVVFLLASINSTEIQELMIETEQHDDILILNYEESHYGLPAKDFHFMEFIEEKCRILDFAYKGDDDTLILPRNLAYHIRNMKDESTAVGSLKSGEEVLRDIESKYYMPQEIEPFDTRPPYFSGAGYVLKGNFALEVAKARHDTPVTPLDDCYFGVMMNQVPNALEQNFSFMMGFYSSARQLAKAIHSNICALAGVTVLHRPGEVPGIYLNNEENLDYTRKFFEDFHKINTKTCPDISKILNKKDFTDAPDPDVKLMFENFYQSFTETYNYFLKNSS